MYDEITRKLDSVTHWPPQGQCAAAHRRGRRLPGHQTQVTTETGGEAASGASAETRWQAAATTANFPEAVRENEEVVPVNAVSTWVLPSGVTVGR